MINDHVAFAPFVLFEYHYEPGHYCLLLDDAHMLQIGHVFEECGANGNGFGWARVARQVVRIRVPEVAAQVEFAPQAAVLAVRGTDLEALRRLGAVLRDVFHVDFIVEYV